MTFICAQAPSKNAIEAMVTDSTYLHRWKDNNEDNNNYCILSSNYSNSSSSSSSSSSSNSRQQSRSYKGFYTSVKFNH